MSVIFNEVVTEIEPQASAGGAASSAQTQAEGEQSAPSDPELARRIARLQERKQRLMAD